MKEEKKRQKVLGKGYAEKDDFIIHTDKYFNAQELDERIIAHCKKNQ